LAKRKRHDDFMLLAPGETVRGGSGNYVVGKVVGTGAFGAVYYAEDPDMPGRKVALKEFFGARNPREQRMLKDLFDRERVVGMHASAHPLMPTSYESFQFDGYYYIAQEFIEGTTLDDIIRKRHPLPREWTLRWSVCLCDALAFLHSRGIIHHDLKPANIRITPQGHLFLLDFGAAQYFGKANEGRKQTEIYGTEGYLPPELDGDGKWVADVRTDIFALGCILYEMIAGEPPDQAKINERSMTITNELMEKPNADLNLVALINRALSYNTEYRFASTNEFLLEMRKTAPPVLLINKKHLRFGAIPSGAHVPPLQITIYNAGGGELRGEIKPRDAWVQVPFTTFKGNKRDVNVIVVPSKIPNKSGVNVGKLEFNSPQYYDQDGKLISSGDRWFIECSASLVLKPGLLQVTERPTADAPPIAITTRAGQPGAGAFELKNVGEKPIDFQLSIPAGQPIEFSISPERGSLEPEASVAVQVKTQPSNLPGGAHKLQVDATVSNGQTLTVPIAITQQSALDFLKSRILRH
jgi:serine/threonine protein kinase